MTDHDISREGLGDALEAIAEQASTTPVADALQEVDQAGTEYGVPSAELLALRKLAAAVRSHGIGADLGQRREQDPEGDPDYDTGTLAKEDARNAWQH